MQYKPHKALLSICIPTANRPICLERLLERLSSETHHPKIDKQQIQVCVYNNGLNAESSDVITNFAKKFNNFKSSSSHKLLPVGDSFENTLNLADGEYVWMIGDDDLPLIGSVERIVNEIYKVHEGQPVVFQLQQYGCEIIDAKVAEMKARCEPVYLEQATEILNPTAFKWLGQMSTVILHRKFYQEKSLFAQRRKDEIIPLLRAIVEAITSGPACCLTGALFARTIEASNWKGMMAFAHSIEFPRYWQILKQRKSGLLKPFSEIFIVKMVMGATLLQHHAPKLYGEVHRVEPVSLLHHLILTLTKIPLPRVICDYLLNKIFAIRSPDQLSRLVEWEKNLN